MCWWGSLWMCSVYAPAPSSSSPLLPLFSFFFLGVLLLRTILTVTGTVFLWCRGMHNTESSSCHKPVLVNERCCACAPGSDRLVRSPLPWTQLGGELQRAGRGMTGKGVLRSGCMREQSCRLAPGSGGSLHLVQAQV